MLKLLDMTTSMQSSSRQTHSLQQLSCSHFLLLYGIEGEEAPADRTKGVIIRIPKKGALSDCNNWCGIMLLSVPSKILAKTIKWILDAGDASMRKEQAGVSKEWGCTDQICTLYNIIERCTEWQTHLYI